MIFCLYSSTRSTCGYKETDWTKCTFISNKEQEKINNIARRKSVIFIQQYSCVISNSQSTYLRMLFKHINGFNLNWNSEIIIEKAPIYTKTNTSVQKKSCSHTMKLTELLIRDILE